MRSIRWIVSLAALGLAFASSVRAQEPDVRDIPPFVMLVVDSSGSMEDLPACTCASATDCTNCAPKCNLANIAGEPPRDGSGHELKKNRWAVTLEALTGKFIDFQCVDVPRTAANGMTYDENYSIPYHQPWKCASGTVCPYPGATIQQSDGILDSYIETLRFGLMTFDGEYTYKGGSDLLDISKFNDTLSTTMPGMWSYGGKQPFKYPGCADTYYVDSGARSATATEGKLISLDSTNCGSATCGITELNAAIQETLLKTRPYGGTPIAASLTDLYDHLKNDVTDSFKECRKRYAILITDGAPDLDFRDLRCDCGDDNPMVTCPVGKPEDFNCPYQLSQDVARKLVAGDGTALNPAQIEKLFVLGMSVQDAEAQKILDKIADAGGTSKALQADDPSTLRSTLDGVFSPLLNPISRSVPGFATGLSGVQYQISTGFQVSSKSLTTTTAPPWGGLIERRSFVCNPTTGKLESPDLENKDRFQTVINAQSKKDLRIRTALPGGTFDRDDLTKHLWRGSDQKCGKDYCESYDISTDSVPAYLFSTDPDDKKKVVGWMYGENGTARDGRQLGDIYHSSPTIIGPPPDIAADDAYARFRETAVVKERPLVMYITTNDGMLRAINVEDFPVKDFPITVHKDDPAMKAGEQMWGFVPPMLLGKLKGQLSSHQFNLDGTPVVKDVFFQRGGTSAEETEYHTVLVTGMRKGGNGYFAMDVTDPYKPKFLWQFTEPDMGLTYGQPEIVQATFKWAPQGETPFLQTRAVAILPGGVGNKKGTTGAETPGCNVFGITLSMRRTSGATVYQSWREDDMFLPVPADHRKAVQCWERPGRVLYFVDVATGQLIKKVFDNDTTTSNGIFFPSPIVGTPTAYLNAVGTTADRGYVMDADGVLWRIDMSSQDVEADKPTKGWTLRPFHDLFWDKRDEYAGGETTYERPILTVDEKKRIVVLVGTGNTDNFENKDADNRIVSLTEVVNTDPAKDPDHYQSLINWELRNERGSGSPYALYPSELVTGSMALFEGQLFAGTFISKVGGVDACEYGRGRLWSLSYKNRDKGHKNIPWDPNKGSDPLTYGPEMIKVVTPTPYDSDDELFNITVDQAVPNMLVQGVGTTQRPSCTKPDPDPLNSYFSPSLANIQQTEPPMIWVVAQASGGKRRAGSGMGGVQAGAQRGPTLSRVTSWATSVD